MDEIVEAALRKWPHVPDCYGWLGLDARGDWYLRDASAQAAGPFPRIKGSRIEHARLRDFIGRNYACNEAGEWYFQNGPQRVYVELEAAPWIWRLVPPASTGPALTTHTGRTANAADCWTDEHGRLFVASDIGLGIVHTQDMESAADAVEQGQWSPQDIRFETLLRRYGVTLHPQPSETKKPATRPAS
ncbi:MAG: DUF2946 family protein [Proteobacteria bacterium]|nr:DUF2946 family protein [Pseudomonadota bacterium]